MIEDRRNFREDKIEEALQDAYRSLGAGKLEEAVEQLEAVLAEDLERSGAASALKCTAFLRERREKADALTDLYEKGEFILSQWKLFAAFMEKLPDVAADCREAARLHVFSTAKDIFLRLLEKEPEADAEVLFRLGRCAKAMGEYGEAIAYLERAHGERREDAALLSELADCYSLVDEPRRAKAFFREALFLDPQGIDLAELESPVFLRLVEMTAARGYTGPELKEWIAVYGTIFGVLSVKREMKPLELGRLKQSILMLEKEIAREPAARGLIPRLINRYFWLIDHYTASHESRDTIAEILSRIRELDPGIYREYAA